jgi:hypothetical protein
MEESALPSGDGGRDVHLHRGRGGGHVNELDQGLLYVALFL